MAIALTTLVEEAERYLNAARISDTAPMACRLRGGRRCGASSAA